MYRPLFGLFCAGVLAAAVPAYGQRAPYSAAPPCESHDPKAWHGLWDGVRGCHYDHQHGADPNSVNDIFGTQLFRDLEGEGPGHPWQTFSAAGLENDLKHAGYIWHVERDLPTPSGRGITDFRVLVHQHPSGRDVPVQFHSGSMEARVRDVDGSTGFVRVAGMWIDFGNLHVDGKPVVDVGNANHAIGTHRQHSSTGTPQGIWYGATWATYERDRRGRVPRALTISTSRHDLWDLTDPANPADFSDLHEFVGHARNRVNATLQRMHLIGVQVPRQWEAQVDPDRDGVADYQGFTDRYGVLQPEGRCHVASLDCAPISFENVKLRTSYDCNQVCAQRYRDFEITFGNRPSGWSQPVP